MMDSLVFKSSPNGGGVMFDLALRQSCCGPTEYTTLMHRVSITEARRFCESGVSFLINPDSQIEQSNES